MATATVKYHEPVPEPEPIESVILTLSKSEAEWLTAVLGLGYGDTLPLGGAFGALHAIVDNPHSSQVKAYRNGWTLDQ